MKAELKAITEECWLLKNHYYELEDEYKTYKKEALAKQKEMQLRVNNLHMKYEKELLKVSKKHHEEMRKKDEFVEKAY